MSLPAVIYIYVPQLFGVRRRAVAPFCCSRIWCVPTCAARCCAAHRYALFARWCGGYLASLPRKNSAIVSGLAVRRMLRTPIPHAKDAVFISRLYPRRTGRWYRDPSGFR